jgi:adenylyltransferase/sulfurtransferase
LVTALIPLKLLTNIGEPLIGRLLLINALAMRFREVRITKTPDCPLCGETPSITEAQDYEAFCGVGPRTTAEQHWEITCDQLLQRVATRQVRMVDVREEWEQEQTPGIPGAISIPYPTFSRRMSALDSADDIVIFCATGTRSWQAVSMLRQAGFTRVWSLRGGLRAYATLLASRRV